MNSEHATAAEPVQPDDDEINLLDLLIVLAKYKKPILAVPFAVALLTAGYSRTLPNIYTATTRILPPQQQQSSAAAMLGQLGALAGVVGGGLGLKNPNDLYVAMIKSRVMADGLIARFDLRRRYGSDSMEDTRNMLAGSVNVVAGKDGLINIEFSDQDPKYAARMANAYVDELYKLTRTLAVTEASQRRLFFERQLKQARDNLAGAEAALKQMQESTGLIQLEGQTQAMLSAVAGIKAQIAAKEVQLSALRAFATEQNPEFQRTQEELAALRGQLIKLERSQGGGAVYSTRQLPGMGLEYMRRARDVKYHETIFDLMTKQFEAAKFDEAKDASLIQVLDKAVEPEHKSKPRRGLMVILAALAAGFMTVIWAFIREAGVKARANPEQAERLDELKRLIRFRTR